MRDVLFRGWKHYNIGLYRAEYDDGCLIIYDVATNAQEFEYALDDALLGMRVENGVLTLGDMEFVTDRYHRFSLADVHDALRFEYISNNTLWIIFRDTTLYGYTDYGFALARLPVRVGIHCGKLEFAWPHEY